MNKNELEPILHQLVDDAVKSTFSNSQWQLEEILGGGLSTSQLYKITVNQQPFVVRYSDPSHAHHNLRREYDAMQWAARQKIAPAVHYADAQTGIALMDFVKSQATNAITSDPVVFTRSIASLIRAIHQGHPFQKDKPLIDKIEFLFSQLRLEVASAPLVQQGIEQIRALAPLLNNPSDERPSHCDINPGNLIFDGKQLWFIDWADATQENFYFDLAGCCNFFFYQSKQAEDAFLQAYFQRPLTEAETAKYRQMRTFVTIYYGLIFVYLGTQQDEPLLTPAEIAALPDYPCFLQRIGRGKERLSDPLSRQRFGFVYLITI